MVEPRPAHVCFHGIGSPQRELEPGEAEYWISEQLFCSILDEIARTPGTEISFDDANASDIEIGLSALRERELSATFFVLAGRLDTAGSLSTKDVQQLAQAGMRIGSHGMNHTPWRGLDAASRHREFVEAREQIAAVVGHAVTTAALPLGRYDRALLAQLKALGYEKIYSSDRRVTSPTAWLQPRFSARSGDTAQSLVEQIARSRALGPSLKLSAVAVAKRLR